MSGRAFAPPLFLLAAAFLCYGGPAIARLGFYHDDWILLSYMRFAPAGFVPAMEGLLRNIPTLWFRPLGLPLYSLLYRLFGLNPVGWQACLLLTNALAAYALFRILLRFSVSERTALLGSLLFLCWPSKDATMFWPFVIINSTSLLAMLAAYLAHLDFVETGRRRSLALSAAAVVVSLTLYDQCVFLFPLWLVTPGLLDKGVPARAKLGATTAAGATAAYLLFKLVFVPRVLLVPFNKTFTLTVFHFLMTYLRGVEANLGPRLILFSLRSLRAAFAAAPFVAAAAAALAWLAPGRSSETRPRPEGPVALVLLGAGVFLLGYLPIAVSDYWPTPIDHTNRINQVPAAGLVLGLIGCGSLVLAPRRLERAAVVLASVLLAVHVGLAGTWAESYRRQLEVRDLILANLPRWTADKLLLVMLPERYVNGKAPVFDAPYDISGAARIWTGDEGRQADTVTPRMVFVPGGIAGASGLIPYGSTLLLDVRGGELKVPEHRDFQGN